MLISKKLDRQDQRHWTNWVPVSIHNKISEYALQGWIPRNKGDRIQNGDYALWISISHSSLPEHIESLILMRGSGPATAGMIDAGPATAGMIDGDFVLLVMTKDIVRPIHLERAHQAWERMLATEEKIRNG